MTGADRPDSRDADLVRRLRNRDEDAFRQLFRAYAPTAKALAQRIVRQSFLADEILQEVFLVLWRKPSSYDPERGSVRAWLMSMVHNRAVDLVRREESQARRAAGSAPATSAEDPAVVALEEVGLAEERAAARVALADLPAEQREILELAYFEGLSQSRIAERLGLPLGTVKSRTWLGMRRLRAALLETGS